MVERHPRVCHICGGKVIYTSNAKIYGKEYGNGKCYLCTKCGAYVGTCKFKPTEAVGLLADDQMRTLQKRCLIAFSLFWKNQKEKDKMQEKLAKELNISVAECNFGCMNLKTLTRAYKIIEEW